MAVNTSPIYPLTPQIGFGTLTTANTAKDGTGTQVTIATGGEFGSRVDQIKVRALGTNVATVMRFFINNGEDNSVATNNSLIHEVTCAATTLSEVDELADIDVVISKGDDTVIPIPYLPAGYKINVAIGTTVDAGLQVTCHYADY
jgi:hypothetical protein